MTNSEQKQILVDWNDTNADYPKTKCIHHFFEEQAESTPSHTAIISGIEHLTYGELLLDVKKLASILNSHNICSDTPVTLLLERSTETVIAIYSILRAGGYYVPIDIEWPLDRIKTVVNDCNPPVLLTCTDQMHKIPADYDGAVLCMDDLPQSTAADLQPIDKPVPSSAVYCLYTSGTTGKPKGVVVEHRGLVKRIQWFQDQYPLSPNDRVLNKTIYTFGISEWEYFWALSYGATLVVASPDGHKDPEYLHKIMIQEKITHSFYVPSLLNILLSYLDTKKLNFSTFITHVYTCGEALTTGTCREFFKVFDARLINLYGPTEADMTYWECPHLKPDEKINVVPIGKPTSNVKVYILDKSMQPVPIGAPGELHFGGEATARGYLNMPDLTAEKFVANPFASGRLYKTGDLVRWLPDGNIEFLGRVDQQVKIRGFRIELSEIETVLNQHQTVKESIVLAREDIPGHRQLVAYVVEVPGKKIKEIELRKLLATKLPEYMVPVHIIKIDSLPLTDHGKISRKKLPAPDKTRPEIKTVFLPPRTPAEKLLANIWCDILRIKRVGIQDNFFDLGGDSVQAVSLFIEIERQLNKQDLPLALFLKAPTIELLAKHINEDHWSDLWSSLVPIQPKGSRPPLFFVHAHGGNVLGYHALAHHLGSDQPFYGLQAAGMNKKEVYLNKLEDIASSYIDEIRIVQPHGPYLLGGWCFGGIVAFEMGQQLLKQGEKVALMAVIENGHPDYPVYLPTTSKFRKLYYQIIDRVNLEINNFVELPSNTKTKYLYERIGRLISGLKMSFLLLLETTLSKMSMNIPHSKAYYLKKLEQVHDKAYMEYRPTSLEGNIALFVSKEQPKGVYIDPTLGWGNVVKGNFEVYEIPGHRLGILSEPRVQIFAEKLKNCIDDALE